MGVVVRLHRTGVNTSGISLVPKNVNVHPARAEVGEKILLNGPIVSGGRYPTESHF